MPIKSQDRGSYRVSRCTSKRICITKVFYTRAAVIEQRSPSTKRVRQRQGVCMEANSTSPVTLTSRPSSHPITCLDITAYLITYHGRPHTTGLPHYSRLHRDKQRRIILNLSLVAQETLGIIRVMMPRADSPAHPRELRKLTARQTFLRPPKRGNKRLRQESQETGSKLGRDTKAPRLVEEDTGSC
jgi:hypothetical protein